MCENNYKLHGCSLDVLLLTLSLKAESFSAAGIFVLNVKCFIYSLSVSAIYSKSFVNIAHIMVKMI